MQISGEVVGTVAVEPASLEVQKGRSWQWKEGDGELRRMSVAKHARGMGVAQALFAELRRFCEQSGHTRIVLSTSSLQHVAHSRLYPALGFELLSRHRIVGKVEVGYFALPLG